MMIRMTRYRPGAATALMLSLSIFGSGAAWAQTQQQYPECQNLQASNLEQDSDQRLPNGLTRAQQATFDQTCKLCHSNPAAGAPLLGDTKAWAPRLAQGWDKLLENTVVGYKGMPPLGLCMACSEEEFIALIEFMSGTRKAEGAP